MRAEAGSPPPKLWCTSNNERGSRTVQCFVNRALGPSMPFLVTGKRSGCLLRSLYRIWRVAQIVMRAATRKTNLTRGAIDTEIPGPTIRFAIRWRICSSCTWMMEGNSVPLPRDFVRNSLRRLDLISTRVRPKLSKCRARFHQARGPPRRLQLEPRSRVTASPREVGSSTSSRSPHGRSQSSHTTWPRLSLAWQLERGTLSVALEFTLKGTARLPYLA